MSKITEQILKKVELLKEKHNCYDLDIAEAMGVTQSAYSRIKNLQRRLSLEQIESVARYFKVPVYYFFFTEGDTEYLQNAIRNYMEIRDSTYEELSKSVGINTLRLIELTNGAVPSNEEIEKFKTTLNFEENSMTDSRLELIELLLKECGMKNEKIEVVLDFIEGNKAKI